MFPVRYSHNAIVQMRGAVRIANRKQKKNYSFAGNADVGG